MVRSIGLRDLAIGQHLVKEPTESQGIRRYRRDTPQVPWNARDAGQSVVSGIPDKEELDRSKSIQALYPNGLSGAISIRGKAPYA